MHPSSLGTYAIAINPAWSTFLHPIAHTSSHALLSSRLVLHLLADLHVDFEEFRDTPIKAHGFAFVKITFAVVGRNAFLRT